MIVGEYGSRFPDRKRAFNDHGLGALRGNLNVGIDPAIDTEGRGRRECRKIELSDDTESRVAEACHDVTRIVGEIGQARTVNVVMYDTIGKRKQDSTEAPLCWRARVADSSLCWRARVAIFSLCPGSRPARYPPRRIVISYMRRVRTEIFVLCLRVISATSLPCSICCFNRRIFSTFNFLTCSPRM